MWSVLLFSAKKQLIDSKIKIKKIIVQIATIANTIIEELTIKLSTEFIFMSVPSGNHSLK